MNPVLTLAVEKLLRAPPGEHQNLYMFIRKTWKTAEIQESLQLSARVKTAISELLNGIVRGGDMIKGKIDLPPLRGEEWDRVYWGFYFTLGLPPSLFKYKLVYGVVENHEMIRCCLTLTPNS